MSFFPPLSDSADSPAAAQIRQLYGFVPKVFQHQQATANILQSQTELMSALLGNEQHLTRIRKELILLAVSAANQSSYGVALHEQTLKLYGVPEPRIATIVEGGLPEGPDAEMISFARRLILQPLESNESAIQSLRTAGFTNAQLVEITVLVGFCNLLNTIQFGNGVTPDFPARAIPPPALHNKVHPEVLESRPIIDDIEVDPDRELVIRAQRGDLEAFEELVARHSQRVYRTLVGLLGNPDDAKDAVQDTFLKVFQSLERFERRAKFSTWLVSIASNTGLQRLRERKHILSLDDDASDREEFRPKQVRAWEADPEQRYSQEQRRDLVERAISHLPAKYRVVLILRDVQQISGEEAAAALELSLPAIKARLLRGRLMLREQLAPHFSEGAQGA